MPKRPKEVILEQERFELKQKSGGGILSYEVYGYVEKGATVVTRYNLAYINYEIFSKDNGRVLGFDNAHGSHHRHFMGVVEPVVFKSHEATLDRFQREWQEIIDKFRRKS